MRASGFPCQGSSRFLLWRRGRKPVGTAGLKPHLKPALCNFRKPRSTRTSQPETRTLEHPSWTWTAATKKTHRHTHKPTHPTAPWAFAGSMSRPQNARLPSLHPPPLGREVFHIRWYTLGSLIFPDGLTSICFARLTAFLNPIPGTKCFTRGISELGSPSFLAFQLCISL